MSNTVLLASTQGLVFKKIFKWLNRFIDEVDIIFNKEGFRITTMDKNHIIFLDLRFDGDKCDQYRCKTDTTIGLCLKTLCEGLSNVKRNDVVKWVYNLGEDTMTMEVWNYDKNIPRITCQIHLLEPSGVIQSLSANKVVLSELSVDLDQLREIFTSMDNLDTNPNNKKETYDNYPVKQLKRIMKYKGCKNVIIRVEKYEVIDVHFLPVISKGNEQFISFTFEGYLGTTNVYLVPTRLV